MENHGAPGGGKVNFVCKRRTERDGSIAYTALPGALWNELMLVRGYFSLSCCPALFSSRLFLFARGYRLFVCICISMFLSSASVSFPYRIGSG